MHAAKCPKVRWVLLERKERRSVNRDSDQDSNDVTSPNVKTVSPRVNASILTDFPTLRLEIFFWAIANRRQDGGSAPDGPDDEARGARVGGRLGGHVAARPRRYTIRKYIQFWALSARATAVYSTEQLRELCVLAGVRFEPRVFQLVRTG